MITKWSELPMGKFKEIQKIDESDELQAALKINAILNDMTVEELLESPLADVTKMSKARAFLGKRPVMRITKKAYDLGGTIYVFDADPYKITTGQWLDFINLPDKQDITAALSIFLIPSGHTYNKGYEIQDVKFDIDKYLSAEEGLSMANFFTTLLGLLYRRAIRKAKRAIRKAKKAGVQTQEAEKLLDAAPKPQDFIRG